jgi:uncharacterized protein YehS (DUF1456 family)
MTNNDILRRLRYTFDYDDAKMIELFRKADLVVSREEVSNWMKKDDHPEFQSLHDKTFATFLNGMINDNRGRREGEQPKPEKTLNNNLILRKLKIALNLKDEDVVDILGLVDIRVSKHEINAFFRAPTQSQYRQCKDQFLRNFIYGLQVKHRGVKKEED